MHNTLVLVLAVVLILWLIARLSGPTYTRVPGGWYERSYYPVAIVIVLIILAIWLFGNGPL